MQQLKLRGGGGTMTLYIRFKRTARLSLLAMTTCNATDTIFFFFLAFILSLCVLAMACCITYIWIITFPSAKCVALPSNPIRCIIYCFLKEWESLKALSFSLQHAECAQNITTERRQVFNWQYSTTIHGSLINEEMFKI